MRFASGDRLDPFEILAPVGAGGMGEVYRARDTRLDRVVAIKVLPTDLVHAPGRRFGYAFRDTSPPGVPDGAARQIDDGTFLVKWANGRIKLGTGEHILGRDPDVEIVLNSPGISRRHAVIRVSGDGATIEDLGSKNGTFVGDRKLKGVRPLRDADIIRVASVELTLTAVRVQTSTETVPEERSPTR